MNPGSHASWAARSRSSERLKRPGQATTSLQASPTTRAGTYDELTVLAMFFGVLLGVIVAIMRLSPNPILSGAAWVYLWIFRGTPVYTQLVFWGLISVLYPRLGLGIPFGPEFVSFRTETVITFFVAAVIGLALNESAYMAEIVRAGIISVDEGQTEAAQAYPSYFSAHPEYKTWEGLKSPAAAKYFATAETGDKGQFLLGDPSYVSYDKDIIKNLDLPFQVVVGGSEATLITTIDKSFKDKSPLLFYFYQPQWAQSKYKLDVVKLPPISKQCEISAADQGKDGKYACDYPGTRVEYSATEITDPVPNKTTTTTTTPTKKTKLRKR